MEQDSGSDMNLPQIGDYKLLSLIDLNPITKVGIYRALRVSDNKEVAIKTHAIDYPPLKDLANLNNEYKIISKLNSDKIIHAYELLISNNHYYLVIDFVDGMSLKSFIAENKKIKLELFYKIANQLLDIIDYVHKNNIIHKDINPYNIFINPKTYELKLIDFSISTELSQEMPSTVLAGTLDYISPEQTGRMNRKVDYRTDYYSLGVVFYELLTGHVPFMSDDPLEIIYFHIAKMPPPIPDIPADLEKIIFKLLSKNVEDRYLSANGIKADLNKVANNEEIVELGALDFKSKFNISQKLYGRKEQINQILSVFHHFLTNGTGHILLVKGPSGMGKSALIQEIQKPLIKYKGIFIRGKYDILYKDEPFLGIKKAVNDLIHYLLAQGDLDKIKQRLQDSIGKIGRALTNLIPELESLLGSPPPLESLPLKEAQNRLFYAFHLFFSVIASKEHPLVIFLDDLQGVDQTSMNLIQDLLTVPYVFFIGAYRDTEVSDAHPLALTLKEIKNKTTIALNPINVDDIYELLRDTLGREDVAELAEEIFKRTIGAPFFVVEFLKSLYDRGLIQFKQSAWHFDLAEIKKETVASNVIDLVVERINRLSPTSKELICLASCIGNSFDLNILSEITETEKDKVMLHLLEIIEAGLILKIGSEYKKSLLGENATYHFVHDKIQEAAYQTIQTDKRVIHLKIAKMLDKEKASIFDIVNQYNRSLEILLSAEEKEHVLMLNLDAAIKAKSSNAYNAAISYLQAARSLSKTVNFKLEKQFAECLSLLEPSAEAEQRLVKLIAIAPTKLDKLDIYFILAYQMVNLGRYEEGLTYSLSGLQLVGIHWPRNPSKLQLLRAYMRFKIALFFKGKENLKLINLLPVTPESEQMQKLAAYVASCSFTLGNLPLFTLLTLTGLLFRVNKGSSIFSSFAIGTYMVSLMGKYQFKEAQFWSELEDYHMFNSTLHNGREEFGIGAFSAPWFESMKESLSYFSLAMKDLLESGDFVYLDFCYVNLSAYTYFMGHSLSKAIDSFKSAQSICKRQGYLEIFGQHETLIKSLIEGREIISDEQIKNVVKHPNVGIVAKFYTYAIENSVLFIHGDYANAYSVAKISLQFAELAKSFAVQAYAAYFYALSALKVYHHLSDKEKKTIQKCCDKLKILSNQNSKDFLFLYLHVEAELKVIERKFLEASQLFERAIDLAETGEYFLYAAIISECAYLFYTNIQQKRISNTYLQIAHYHYSHWGASDKAKKMEIQNPLTALGSINSEESLIRRTNPSSNVKLDIDSIIKASEVISSEMILENLFVKLIDIIKKNAGAQRVVIIKEHQGKFFIEAEGLTNDEVKIYHQKQLTEENVPLSIIQGVMINQASIALDDASKEPGDYYQDPYLIQNLIKSLLCLPIIFQGKVNGIIYLENNVASHVFNEQRIHTLNILASQAAISLENAKYFKASNRFVPIQFLKELAKRTIVDIEIGDQVQKKMCVLVLDIRNFTTQSEKLNADQVLAMLNNFLRLMEPIIREHNGFIDKYIGDAIMALFPEKADDGLNCAIEMIRNLPSDLQVGIGINTGELILGILGGAERLNSTVIGDSVNTAFRIEGITKQYKTPIIISEDTKNSLERPSNYFLRFIDKVYVKGKVKPVEIWEVCDADPPQVKLLKQENLNLYLKAKKAYDEENWGDALKLFQLCLDRNPEDTIAEYFFNLCQKKPSVLN